MAPTSQAATNSDIQGAVSQGNALQNQYNTQAAQQYGAYQGAQGNANTTQQNLQNFAGSMQNYGNQYSGDFTDYLKTLGVDPAALQAANTNLSRTSTTLANLPQSTQQIGGGYGTLAGSEASNYSNMGSQLQGQLTGASNAANSFQNSIADASQLANNQVTQQTAGQASQLQGYQAAAANAQAIMDTTGKTMAAIEALQQQQGSLTAQQVAAYQNAYSSYISAQAAQTAAAAQMKMAQAQTSEAATAAQIAAQKATQPAATTSPAGSSNNYLSGLESQFGPQLTQYLNDIKGFESNPVASGATNAIGGLAAPLTGGVSSLISGLLGLI